MANDFSILIQVLLIAFLILLIHYSCFLTRIIKGLRNLKLNSSEALPHEFISVIIPFRDEEKNILANLKSIESQLYPEDKYEVIYVDDSSEDNSIDLLRSNVKRKNIRILSVPKDFSVNSHKKRAIRYGIEKSNGKIIVTTDADCVHQKEWLISLVKTFNSLTGFVSGPVEFLPANNLFSKFQQLEFAGLVICGAGLIGSGHPTICNAANIAYRKKNYDEVGGFKDQMDLSSGDDELLMQKISKDSDFTVKFCIDKRAIVKTSANRTIGEFYQQRKRWASKGLFYSDKSLVLKLILIYLFYAGLLAQLVLLFLIHQIFLLSLVISLTLKLILEFYILSKGKQIIFDSLDLKYFLVTEIIQIPYIIIAGLVGVYGNYFWKKRKIKR